MCNVFISIYCFYFRTSNNRKNNFFISFHLFCFCFSSTVCIVKQQKLHKFTSIGRLPSTAVFCIHFFFCWPHSCHVEICIEFNLLNYSTNISFLCPFFRSWGTFTFIYLYILLLLVKRTFCLFFNCHIAIPFFFVSFLSVRFFVIISTAVKWMMENTCKHFTIVNKI